MRALLWLVVLSACAAPRVEAPPPTASAPGASRPASAKKGRSLPVCGATTSALPCVEAPATVSCPSAFAEVTPGATCGAPGRTSPQRCVWPEGHCLCAQHEREPACSGMAPRHEPPPTMRWRCRPTPKPGDCPEEVPSSGAPCEGGEACRYQACTSSAACACVDGRWACEQRSHPPPPSRAPGSRAP